MATIIVTPDDGAAAPKKYLEDLKFKKEILEDMQEDLNFKIIAIDKKIEMMESLIKAGAT